MKTFFPPFFLVSKLNCFADEFIVSFIVFFSKWGSRVTTQALSVTTHIRIWWQLYVCTWLYVMSVCVSALRFMCRCLCAKSTTLYQWKKRRLKTTFRFYVLKEKTFAQATIIPSNRLHFTDITFQVSRVCRATQNWRAIIISETPFFRDQEIDVTVPFNKVGA